MQNNNRSNDHRYATAGSLVLEKPSSSQKTTSQARTDGGNLQLMEARLMELQSSLRALYKSNEEIQQFINDNDDDDNNQDFRDAIEENWTAMRNQRSLAMELVSEMKRRGVNIDLPGDICDMNIPAHKEEKKPQEHDSSSNANTETGIYL